MEQNNIIRIKDSSGKTAGFVINKVFYTTYIVKDMIRSGKLTNLRIIKGGIIKAKYAIASKTIMSTVNKYEYNRITEQNPFERDIQSELIKWKNFELHKVLQLNGGRQAGKTTELLKFAYKHYDYVIYVNMADDRFNFLGVLGNGSIIENISNYCKAAGLMEYDNSKRTVLIIDEIQASKNVYNSIRYMHEPLKCDIIVTESYLGQVINGKYFIPAGTVDMLNMFSMSFREFCKTSNMQSLLDNISLHGESLSSDYDKLYKLYDIYIKIGGYPEVVKTYIATHDFNACYDKIEELLAAFKLESSVYFTKSKEPLIFDSVYTEAFYSMCSEKRGTGKNIVEDITTLVKNYQKSLISRDEISKAITWLIHSGIIGECGLYNNGDIEQYIPARRMYFMDCGIASYISKQTSVDGSNITGIIAETFAYDELYKIYKKKYSERLIKGDAPCFSIYGNNELDFLVLGKDNTQYGIEIKAATGTINSLKVYIDKKLVDRGILAKRTYGGKSDTLDTIPIYTIGSRFPYI